MPSPLVSGASSVLDSEMGKITGFSVFEWLVNGFDGAIRSFYQLTFGRSSLIVWYIVVWFILLGFVEFFIWGYETPFAYVLLRLPYWAYHNSWSYSWVAFKTAGHCHFPRVFWVNCNELLDLGLLVRHPRGGAVADIGVIDDLQNSHCGTLMDYEVVVRKQCGAATSKFFYNYWISLIRTG